LNRLIIILALLASGLCAYGQTQKQPVTLKSVPLEQLKTTHSVKDWFVPVNVALEGLTPEQASWKDKSGNHSIGQLANHLLFWNSQELAKFRGEKPSAYSGDNNETFNNFDAKNWADTVRKLDEGLTAWETAVANSDEAKLQSWYSVIAHIGTHNAYHTGQIIFIRRQQGSWNPENGVK
jgi:uncharacterized damage-inducible protein DinB